ncbi:MAG: polysaccharide deacetylase family protein [Deltaproteobacteria bacterium]|nr:polysaccharide deacetylase family protein [Deltaproteobacteria bacterium]
MTDSSGRSPRATLRAIAGPIVRRTRAWAGLATGASARARARLDGSCAAVLMYHRVLPSARARRLHVEPGMYVTPETFARHLDWLAESFALLSLAEIVEHLESGAGLPRGACALTFDDGWRDNLEYALPALRARGLPATIFAVSDRVGTTGAFWPDEVCRRLAPLGARERTAVLRGVGLPLAPESGEGVEAALLALKALDEAERGDVLEGIRRATKGGAAAFAEERELLDWNELDRLAEQGVSIESHGASHAILTGVSRVRAQEELTRSLAVLRARGHARLGLLAYPSGAFDDTVVELARAAGYRAAFTTQVGLASRGEDGLRQPRVAVHEDISRSRAEFLRFVPGAARAANAAAGDDHADAEAHA